MAHLLSYSKSSPEPEPSLPVTVTGSLKAETLLPKTVTPPSFPPALSPDCLSSSPSTTTAPPTSRLNAGRDPSPQSDGSSPISYFCGDGPHGGSSPPLTRYQGNGDPYYRGSSPTPGGHHRVGQHLLVPRAGGGANHRGPSAVHSTNCRATTTPGVPRPAAGSVCVDVCEAAMDLVAFLESDSLPKLEKVFKQRSHNKEGALTRPEFVSLLSQVISGITSDRRSSSKDDHRGSKGGGAMRGSYDAVSNVNLGSWRNSIVPTAPALRDNRRKDSVSITTSEGQSRRATSASLASNHHPLHSRSVSPAVHQPPNQDHQLQQRKHQMAYEDEEQQEDQYQALLDATAEHLIDTRVLTYVAQCVDPYAGDKITFSAFLDFLVQSGRSTSRGLLGSIGGSNGEDSDAEVINPSSGGTGGHVAKNKKSNEGMSPIVVPAATHSPDPNSIDGKAPYVFFTTVDKEFMPFVGATRRYAEIVDAFGQANKHCKRMIPPIDPSETITCLHYASSVNEVFVGATNCKVYSFSVPEGKLLRECRASLVPRCLAWAAPPLILRKTALASEARVGPHSTSDSAKAAAATGHQPTGFLYVGLEDGTLVGMSAPLSGVLRVNTSVKVGATAIEAIEVVPGVGSIVCACGRAVVVACSVTGALRQKPYKAESPVTALFHHAASGGLAFTVRESPNSVFFFSRRTLNSVANEPAEIVRDRSTIGEATVAITQDPSDSNRGITVDISGFLRYWNLSTLQPVYNVAGDTSGGSSALMTTTDNEIETLRVPGAPSGVAMSSMPGTLSIPGSAMFLTKYGLYKVIQVKTRDLAAAAKEADVLQGIGGTSAATGLSTMGGSTLKKANMTTYDPDTLVAILPCNPRHHGSVTHALGFHPKSCVFSVTSSEVKLQHFQSDGGGNRRESVSAATAVQSSSGGAGVKVNKTLWTIQLDVKIREATSRSLSSHSSSAQLRPTAACFLPGGMVLLLGCSSGALFTVSVEPSQQGACHMVSENFCDVEISQLIVDSQSKTLVAILFDGITVAAQIQLDPSNYTHPVKVGGHSRMTGLSHVKSATFDEERRLCYFLDVTGAPAQCTPARCAPAFKLHVFDFGAPHEGIRWRAELPLDAPPGIMPAGFESTTSNSSPTPSSARMKNRHGTYGFIFSPSPDKNNVASTPPATTTSLSSTLAVGDESTHLLFSPARGSSPETPQTPATLRDPTTCHALLHLLPASNQSTPRRVAPTSSFFLTSTSSKEQQSSGGAAQHSKLGLLMAWGTGESSLMVISYCAETRQAEVDQTSSGARRHFHFSLGGPPTDFCIPSGDSHSCYVAHSHGDLSHVPMMASIQIAFPSLLSPTRGGGGGSPYQGMSAAAAAPPSKTNMVRPERLFQVKQCIKHVAHLSPVFTETEEGGPRDYSAVSAGGGGLAFGTDSDCYLVEAAAMHLLCDEEDDTSFHMDSSRASNVLSGSRGSYGILSPPLLGAMMTTPQKLMESGGSFCIGGGDSTSASLQGSLSAAIVARRRQAHSATVRRTPGKGSASGGLGTTALGTALDNSGSRSSASGIDQRASFMLPTGALKKKRPSSCLNISSSKGNGQRSSSFLASIKPAPSTPLLLGTPLSTTTTTMNSTASKFSTTARVASATAHRPVSGFGTAAPGVLKVRNINSAFGAGTSNKLPPVHHRNQSRTNGTTSMAGEYSFMM